MIHVSINSRLIEMMLLLLLLLLGRLQIISRRWLQIAKMACARPSLPLCLACGEGGGGFFDTRERPNESAPSIRMILLFGKDKKEKRGIPADSYRGQGK